MNIKRYTLAITSYTLCILLLISTPLQASTMTNVHYLFSHGMTDDAKQATRYIEYTESIKNERDEGPAIITHPYKALNYTDAALRIWRANLAQEGDITALEEAYNEIVGEQPNADIVLVGVSRGAATALGFLAHTNPSNIRAVVLESPFDSVDELLARQLYRFFHQSHKRLANALHKHLVPAILRDYRPSGPAPVDAVPWIRTDLPILVVCSRKDGIVPVGSSIEIYNQLRATAHENVHILELDRGEHARIKRNSPEGERYRNVVHAFYKNYSLPHNPEWAQQGLLAFEQTHPTMP